MEIALGIACAALVSRLVIVRELSPKLVALVRDLTRRADRFATEQGIGTRLAASPLKARASLRQARKGCLADLPLNPRTATPNWNRWSSAAVASMVSEGASAATSPC